MAGDGFDEIPAQDIRIQVFDELGHVAGLFAPRNDAIHACIDGHQTIGPDRRVDCVRLAQRIAREGRKKEVRQASRTSKRKASPL